MSRYEAVRNEAGGFKVTITNPEPPWTKDDGKRISDYFFKGPQITLNSGIVINLQNLKQHLTYATVLEGIPWGPYFNGYVENQVRWFKEERKKYGEDNPAFVVIEPEVLDLPVSAGVLQSMHKFYKKEPVSIAPVACRGRFENPNAVRGGDKFEFSVLTIFWFQQEFLSPIPEYVIERIKGIDWEAVAENWEL